MKLCSVRMHWIPETGCVNYCLIYVHIFTNSPVLPLYRQKQESGQTAFGKYLQWANIDVLRITEANKMHYFSTLFWYTTPHVSGRLTVHHQEPYYCIHSNRYLSYWLCWLLADSQHNQYIYIYIYCVRTNIYHYFFLIFWSREKINLHWQKFEPNWTRLIRFSFITYLLHGAESFLKS